MKKIILSMVTLIVITISSNAQVYPHAIGLRFGGSNFGSGAEVSYQHGIGDKNRIELDLGWGGNSNYHRIGLSGIYHWVWNIDGGFNWYAGPGAQIWSYSYKTTTINSNNKNKVVVTSDVGGVKLAIGGQIGIEYDFNERGVPIQVSLDTRPMINFGFKAGNFGYGLGLSVRYTF